MKIRTVLYLMFGAIVVIVLSILYGTNKDTLDSQIVFGHGLHIPVWFALLLASGVSMLVPLLFGVLRDLRRMLRDFSVRRQARSRQEAEELYLRGVESMLNGREERALEHFNEVLAIDPNHFEALLKGGEVLRGLRRYAEAIEFHRRAARVKEDDLHPLYSLVSDYEESGAPENAKAVLNRIIELNPKRSLAASRKYRAICVSEGAWEKAWEIQKRIEDQLSDMGRSRKAEKKYHLGIRYMLAQSLLQAGKARDAVGTLRRLVGMEPAFVPAPLALGRALLALRQPEEAVEVWEKAYEATGHPIFLSTIEDHYLGQEQPRRAIEALKAAIWKSKKDIIPRFFLGKLYYRLEMIDEKWNTSAPPAPASTPPGWITASAAENGTASWSTSRRSGRSRSLASAPPPSTPPSRGRVSWPPTLSPPSSSFSTAGATVTPPRGTPSRRAGRASWNGSAATFPRVCSRPQAKRSACHPV